MLILKKNLMLCLNLIINAAISKAISSFNLSNGVVFSAKPHPQSISNPFNEAIASIKTNHNNIKIIKLLEISNKPNLRNIVKDDIINNKPQISSIHGNIRAIKLLIQYGVIS